MSRPTKRRVDFRGLPINIELEVGDTKSGTDAGGQPWSVTYKYPYGEIARTDGADGDPVDCYLGPVPEMDQVTIVHQMHQDLGGDGRLYDEDKVFLGFGTIDAAIDAYFSHGPSWGMGGATVMTFDEFKNDWLKRGPMRGRNQLMFGGAP